MDDIRRHLIKMDNFSAKESLEVISYLEELGEPINSSTRSALKDVKYFKHIRISMRFGSKGWLRTLNYRGAITLEEFKKITANPLKDIY